MILPRSRWVALKTWGIALLAAGLSIPGARAQQEGEHLLQIRDQYRNLMTQVPECSGALLEKIDLLRTGVFQSAYFLYTLDENQDPQTIHRKNQIRFKDLLPKLEKPFREAGRTLAPFWKILKLFDLYALEHSGSDPYRGYRVTGLPLFPRPLSLKFFSNVTLLPNLSSEGALLHWMDWDLLPHEKNWEEASREAERMDWLGKGAGDIPNPAAIHALEIEIPTFEPQHARILEKRLQAMVAEARKDDPRFGVGYLKSAHSIKVVLYNAFTAAENLKFAMLFFEAMDRLTPETVDLLLR